MTLFAHVCRLETVVSIDASFILIAAFLSLAEKLFVVCFGNKLQCAFRRVFMCVGFLEGTGDEFVNCLKQETFYWL